MAELIFFRTIRCNAILLSPGSHERRGIEPRPERQLARLDLVKARARGEQRQLEGAEQFAVPVDCQRVVRARFGGPSEDSLDARGAMALPSTASPNGSASPVRSLES